MGKRLLFMILAVLLVLWGLSGCRKAEPDDGNAENSEENSLPAASESSASGEGTASALDQTNTGKLAMIHYRVTDRIYHNDTKSLCYPQITGLSNTETETACNAWIEQIAMRVLQSDARCELSYEVTSETPQLLSLFITEKRYPEDATEPQMQYYTLNLDVQTGSVLTLSDFVDLKILARDVVTGECTVEKNAEAAGAYLSALSADTLAEEFQNYDFAQGREEPSGFSYIRSGKLHVLLPALPTLGGYLDVTTDAQKQGSADS